MSGYKSKHDYPHRPARKGKPKSSENGGHKRKTWVSLRTHFEGGRDLSPRLTFRWFDAPIYKLDRIRRWHNV